MVKNDEEKWKCECGALNSKYAKYCLQCGRPKEEGHFTNVSTSADDLSAIRKPISQYAGSHRGDDVPIWILVYCVLIPLVGWLFEAAYIAHGDEDKAKKILIVQAVTYFIIICLVLLFAPVLGL